MNQENLLGMKIREARKAVKLTQAALAHRMDRTVSTIDNWENARRVPSEEDAQLLQVLLKINLSGYNYKAVCACEGCEEFITKRIREKGGKRKYCSVKCARKTYYNRRKEVLSNV